MGWTLIDFAGRDGRDSGRGRTKSLYTRERELRGATLNLRITHYEGLLL